MLFPHPKPSTGRKKNPGALLWLTKPRAPWFHYCLLSISPSLPHLPLLPLKPLSAFQPQELYLTFCLWNFIPAGTLISGSAPSVLSGLKHHSSRGLHCPSHLGSSLPLPASYPLPSVISPHHLSVSEVILFSFLLPSPSTCFSRTGTGSSADLPHAHLKDDLC